VGFEFCASTDELGCRFQPGSWIKTKIIQFAIYSKLAPFVFFVLKNFRDMLEAVFDTVFNGEMLVYQKKRREKPLMEWPLRFVSTWEQLPGISC